MGVFSPELNFSASKLSQATILQLLADPYHTEFVIWYVDHFQPIKILSTKGGGGGGIRPLVEFSTNFFETFPKKSKSQKTEISYNMEGISLYE